MLVDVDPWRLLSEISRQPGWDSPAMDFGTLFSRNVLQIQIYQIYKIKRLQPTSDRQNKEHIRENRTKNRTNNRQNRMLQKNPNILLFIRLELYRITRPNSFVFILQNNQTEMALEGEPFVSGGCPFYSL